MIQLEKGFTLLEILAALAITTVGIAALVSTMSSAVAVLQSTENRSLATWVASNRLAELRISRAWPAASTRDSAEELGGRTWFYRESISETADAELLRVDMSVYSDKEHSSLEAQLFGYLSRYAEPEAPQPGNAVVPDEELDDSAANIEDSAVTGGADEPVTDSEVQQ